MSASSTSIAVALNNGDTATSRTWRVKVTQYQCSNLAKAPHDCGQYYTGTSGTTQNYNYPNVVLQSQNSSTCIRKAAGFCSINWSEAGNTSPDAFLLGDVTIAAETTTCTIAYVAFPNISVGPTAVVANTLCGGFLSTIDADIQSGVVTQTTPPFNFYFRSSNAGQTSATGYNLQWNQVPC